MASRGAGEGQGAVALADLCRLVSDAVQSSGDADLAAAAAALQQPHPGDDSGRAHGSEATPAEIADDGLALFARAATQHGSLRTRLSEPDSLDLFAAVFRDAACEAQWGQAFEALRSLCKDGDLRSRVAARCSSALDRAAQLVEHTPDAEAANAAARFLCALDLAPDELLLRKGVAAAAVATAACASQDPAVTASRAAAQPRAALAPAQASPQALSQLRSSVGSVRLLSPALGQAMAKTAGAPSEEASLPPLFVLDASSLSSALRLAGPAPRSAHDGPTKCLPSDSRFALARACLGELADRLALGSPPSVVALRMAAQFLQEVAAAAPAPSRRDSVSLLRRPAGSAADAVQVTSPGRESDVLWNGESVRVNEWLQVQGGPSGGSRGRDPLALLSQKDAAAAVPDSGATLHSGDGSNGATAQSGQQPSTASVATTARSAAAARLLDADRPRDAVAGVRAAALNEARCLLRRPSQGTAGDGSAALGVLESAPPLPRWSALCPSEPPRLSWVVVYGSFLLEWTGAGPAAQLRHMVFLPACDVGVLPGEGTLKAVGRQLQRRITLARDRMATAAASAAAVRAAADVVNPLPMHTGLGEEDSAAAPSPRKRETRRSAILSTALTDRLNDELGGKASAQAGPSLGEEDEVDSTTTSSSASSSRDASDSSEGEGGSGGGNEEDLVVSAWAGRRSGGQRRRASVATSTVRPTPRAASDAEVAGYDLAALSAVPLVYEPHPATGRPQGPCHPLGAVDAAAASLAQRLYAMWAARKGAPSGAATPAADSGASALGPGSDAAAARPPLPTQRDGTITLVVRASPQDQFFLTVGLTGGAGQRRAWAWLDALRDAQGSHPSLATDTAFENPVVAGVEAKLVRFLPLVGGSDSGAVTTGTRPGAAPTGASSAGGAKAEGRDASTGVRALAALQSGFARGFGRLGSRLRRKGKRAESGASAEPDAGRASASHSGASAGVATGRALAALARLGEEEAAVVDRLLARALRAPPWLVNAATLSASLRAAAVASSLCTAATLATAASAMRSADAGTALQGARLVGFVAQHFHRARFDAQGALVGTAAGQTYSSAAAEVARTLVRCHAVSSAFCLLRRALRDYAQALTEALGGSTGTEGAPPAGTSSAAVGGQGESTQASRRPANGRRRRRVSSCYIDPADCVAHATGESGGGASLDPVPVGASGGEGADAGHSAPSVDALLRVGAAVTEIQACLGVVWSLHDVSASWLGSSSSWSAFAEDAVAGVPRDRRGLVVLPPAAVALVGATMVAHRPTGVLAAKVLRHVLVAGGPSLPCEAHRYSTPRAESRMQAVGEESGVQPPPQDAVGAEGAGHRLASLSQLTRGLGAPDASSLAPQLCEGDLLGDSVDAPVALAHVSMEAVASQLAFFLLESLQCVCADVLAIAGFNATASSSPSSSSPLVGGVSPSHMALLRTLVLLLKSMCEHVAPDQWEALSGPWEQGLADVSDLAIAGGWEKDVEEARAALEEAVNLSMAAGLDDESDISDAELVEVEGEEADGGGSSSSSESVGVPVDSRGAATAGPAVPGPAAEAGGAAEGTQPAERVSPALRARRSSKLLAQERRRSSMLLPRRTMGALVIEEEEAEDGAQRPAALNGADAQASPAFAAGQDGGPPPPRRRRASIGSVPTPRGQHAAKQATAQAAAEEARARMMTPDRLSSAGEAGGAKEGAEGVSEAASSDSAAAPDSAPAPDSDTSSNPPQPQPANGAADAGTGTGTAAQAPPAESRRAAILRLRAASRRGRSPRTQPADKAPAASSPGPAAGARIGRRGNAGASKPSASAPAAASTPEADSLCMPFQPNVVPARSQNSSLPQVVRGASAGGVAVELVPHVHTRFCDRAFRVCTAVGRTREGERLRVRVCGRVPAKRDEMCKYLVWQRAPLPSEYVQSLDPRSRGSESAPAGPLQLPAAIARTLAWESVPHACGRPMYCMTFADEGCAVRAVLVEDPQPWYAGSGQGGASEVVRSPHDAFAATPVDAAPTKGAAVSPIMGPVEVAPPKARLLEVRGEPRVGARLLAVMDYFGGQIGACEYQWLRVRADGTREELASPVAVSGALAREEQDAVFDVTLRQAYHGATTAPSSPDALLDSAYCAFAERLAHMRRVIVAHGDSGEDPRIRVLTQDDLGCKLKCRCRPVREDGEVGIWASSKATKRVGPPEEEE